MKCLYFGCRTEIGGLELSDEIFHLMLHFRVVHGKKLTLEEAMDIHAIMRGKPPPKPSDRLLALETFMRFIDNELD